MGKARAIADRAYAAMAAHDTEAFLALCSPTCEFTEGGMRMAGHEQLRGVVQGYFTAFPDMRVDVIDAIGAPKNVDSHGWPPQIDDLRGAEFPDSLYDVRCRPEASKRPPDLLEVVVRR